MKTIVSRIEIFISLVLLLFPLTAAQAADVDVVWTDLVGVSVNGDELIKTAGNGWGNGGAASSKGYSGDFTLEFTTDQDDSNWVCGLSSDNTDASWDTIDFAIYLKFDSTVEIIEDDTLRGSYSTYTTGDTFQVERSGTTIYYKKNDTTIYTSGVTSTGTLLADAAMYYPGNPISDAKFTGVTATAPEAVFDLSGNRGNGQVVLNWTAPSDNGSAITGYEVQYGTVTSGIFNMTYTDDATPGATITGLTNGTEYQFRVVTSNVIGTSAPSNVVAVTPNTVHTVAWTGLSGVTAIGNDLTKTTSNGWGNSGASSSETQSGDLVMEFTATETNTYRMCGLSDSNTDANYTSIDYAVYLAANGNLYVYEGGTSRGLLDTYQTGDILRIERTGTTISYKKNGSTFYTSGISSSGDLLVDTALYSTNATIQDVIFVGVPVAEPGTVLDLTADVDTDGEVELFWRAPSEHGSPITEYEVQYGTVTSGTFNMTYTDDTTPGATITGLNSATAYQFRVVTKNSIGSGQASGGVQIFPNVNDVTWTDLVGVSANGNDLTKTGVNGWGTGGAASDYSYSSDVTLKFIVKTSSTYDLCGLSSDNTDASWDTIDYGIFLGNYSSIDVYESGVFRGSFGTYQVGDVLKIQRIGTTITYRKNNTLLYTSTVTSTGPLLADATIYYNGFTLEDVQFSGIPVQVPGSSSDLAGVFGDSAINLTWSAPANNGSAITGYKVQYGTVTSGTFNMTYTDDASPGATITGLTNGTEYQFRVLATNSVGEGASSNVTEVTPNTVIPVVWTDRTGVTADGNSLTSTASGWGYSGAASSEKQSGNFAMEFTATETNTHRMCGLSDSNTDANYTSIDYAVYLATNAVLYVYENGTSRGSFGTYQAGDILRVERSGTTITYKKNGTTFYTSGVSSSGDLLVDTALYTTNATISSVVFVGPAIREPGAPLSLDANISNTQVELTWEAPSDNGSPITEYEVQYGTVTSGTFNTTYTDDTKLGATITGLTNETEYQFRVVATNAIGTGVPSSVVEATPDVTVDVVWTDITGVTADGNSLTKVVGTAWGNAGAASTKSYSGDFALECVATETNTYRMCGLSDTNTNANYTSIDFAVHLTANATYEVYESGTLRGSYGSYQSGDRFQVERSGTSILYQKNNSTFYTSGLTSTGTLLADTALYSVYSTLTNVRFIGVTAEAPDAITNLGGDNGTDGQVSLSWSAPSNNGLPITEYEVQYGTVTSGTFNMTYTDDASPGATITGLTNGTEYHFRVIAKNSEGSSPVSNTAQVTPSIAVDVVWTDLVGVSANGNSITKTAANGWGNAGAASVVEYDGDFGVLFMADSASSNWLCGFSSTNTDADWDTIDYGVYLKSDGTVEVYESGTLRGSYGTFQAGDTFKVERDGTTIKYKKNGAPFYTSGVSSSGDLLVDASMYYSGSKILTAQFTGLPTSEPDAVDDLSATAGENEVSLDWSEPDDNNSPITSYEVQYGTVTSGTFNNFASQGPVLTGTLISGLINDIQYQFRMIATNAVGDSLPSNTVTATPEVEPFAAQIFQPVPDTTVSDSVVQFQWDAGVDVDAYQLTVGTTPGDDDIEDSGQITGTAYSVDGLTINGNPIYVRLSSLIDGMWEDVDYAYDTSTTPVITFWGAGADYRQKITEYPEETVTESINYCLQVEFEVSVANPVQNGDILTYDLTSKDGDVYFEASGQELHEYTAGGSVNYSFESFDISNGLTDTTTSGTYQHSISNPNLIEINFEMSPSSNPRVNEIWYVSSDANGFKQTLTAAYDNWPSEYSSPFFETEYFASGSSGEGVCSMTVEMERSRVLPGDILQLFGVAPVNCDDELVWEVIPVVNSTARGVITPDDDRGVTATLSDITGEGLLEVRSTNPSIGNCQRRIFVYVGCDSCQSSAPTPSGPICIMDSSIKNSAMIDMTVDLANGKRGISAGHIRLAADAADPANATPATLDIKAYSSDTEVLYEGEYPRQVITEKIFVDIDVVDQYTYDIIYYDIADKGDKVSGYYEVATGATPLKTWRVQNPDTSSAYNRLWITETVGMDSTIYEYDYDSVADDWTLDSGSGLRVETTSESTTGNTRTLVSTVEDDSSNVASVTETTWKNLTGHGEEMIEVVEDPNGDALTTTYTYYEDAGEPYRYGRIASVVNPDGSWVKYDYDSMGRMILEVSSWLDEPVTADPEDARAVYYDYTIQDTADSELKEDERRQRRVTETILDETVSDTLYVYSQAADGTRTVITERADSQGASFGDTGNLRTTTVYNPYGAAASSWRVQNVTHPDGRMDTYEYSYGTYTPDIDPSVPGTFAIGTGTDEQHIVTHGTTSNPDGVAYKTTREVTYQNRQGEVLYSATELYDGSDYYPFSWALRYYDAYGHVTDEYHHDGTDMENTWDCCTLESQIDRNGIEHSYTYDDIKRVLTMTKDATTDVATSYTYDAAGRRLTETVTSGTLSLDTEMQYDLSGRIEESTDQGGLVTEYAYSTNNRITTVTRPDSETEVTAQFIDGQSKSVTGTGVVAQYFTYGVNTDGTRWTQVNISGSSSPNYVKTTTDMLGRTVKEERPGYSATETTEYFYNSLGQLEKVETTGQADILYEYDVLGNQVRSGLDVNDNGSLDLSSTDRITATDTTFTFVSPNWWQETFQEVYATDNSSTPTQTGVQYTLLTGLGSGLTGETVTEDIHGKQTVATTEVDAANKTTTRTVDYPDSNTDGLTVTVNGLVIAETSKTGITATFGYDTLERRVQVIDPRTGTSLTGYNATTGWVDFVRDAAGNQVTYTYDTNSGRKTSETDALSQKTYFAYNSRGQVTRVWGDVPYPVEYTYDSYGRLATMNTWRTSAAWNGSTWPTGVSGQEDTTTWNYQASTGLLTSKTDDAGESVSYTYTTGGRLSTRTWARSSGSVTTTYGYDAATTELTDIDYSDSTTSIDFTYDRLGRMETVDDELGGRDFTYNSDLQLEEEDIAGLYNKTITRTYATTGVVGRPTGLNTGTDYSVSYDYDTKGRLDEVGWSVSSGTYTGTATYGYLANSDLIETLDTTAGQATTYSYESNRNLRTQIDNDFSSTNISQYDYSYDELGRRSWVKNSGSAFAAAAFNHFDYNPRSELQESARYLGTDETVLTSPVTGEYRGWDYDPIGNRKTSTVGMNGGIYTANNLNQYTGENVPGGGSNSFTFDEDGNLTAISGNKDVTYTYNAENRLITAEPTTPAVNDKKIDLVYDYQGRRVEKEVSNYNGSSWVSESVKRYVYDGWNVLEEQTVSSNSKYYVWGLDLSQSMQGAGGVGGLLTQVDIGATKSYAYLYDGNGNVGQLIDNSDGSIDAHYEYDPYGNSILASGTAAAGNPYRFSTKYLDLDYGLYDYGRRLYDPDLGRWLSRDPIEERGGLNLYAFVVNNSTNKTDPFGLTSFSDIPSRLFYTWHMGWLDVSHMGKNSSLVDAWRRIKRARNGEIVSIVLSQSQREVKFGPFRSRKVTDAYFCINVDKSIEKNQLLYAWMSLSHGFEAFQSQGIQDNQFVNTIYGARTGEIDKIASGFSTEDLVSNLVSFYSVVDEKLWESLLDGNNNRAGRFNAGFFGNDEEIISKAIWQYSLKPEKGGALKGIPWRPQYFDHEEFQVANPPNPGFYDGSRLNLLWAQILLSRYNRIFGEPKFPSYFTTYKPTSKGVSSEVLNSDVPSRR